MKKFIPILLAVTMTAFCVRAEDNSRELAQELLEMMDIQTNIEKSFDMIRKMQLAQLQQAGIEESMLGIQQEFMDKMMDLLADELSWDNLKDDYITIYTDFFTPDDMRGIIRFYNSPVGKKFLEKQPELMQRSMQISQKQMMEIMPKVRALTEEFKAMVMETRKKEAGVPMPPPVE